MAGDVFLPEHIKPGYFWPFAISPRTSSNRLFCTGLPNTYYIYIYLIYLHLFIYEISYQVTFHADKFYNRHNTNLTFSKSKYNKTILINITASKDMFQRRQWHPTPALLPGKSHGLRSSVGCSPWGRYESDMTERLHFHFSLSCIGEGNGNPLQCSCLENPREGGAW